MAYTLSRLATFGFALLVVSTPNASQIHAAGSCVYEGGQSYRLTELDRLQTTVTVRSGPSQSRTNVYELPMTARTIRCVGPCRDGWCRVRWHGVVGWIPRRHLAEDGRVRWTTKSF